MKGDINAAAHTLTVTLGEDKTETWNYALSGDKLTIDATHAGHKLHVALEREPAPLLVSRGFHWIQEFPFNR